MSNIGLLVRCWGRVTNPVSSSFTLDDGSATGTKVVLPAGVAVPSAESYVQVTGISSCEQDADGLHRLLRVRGAADIQAF